MTIPVVCDAMNFESNGFKMVTILFRTIILVLIVMERLGVEIQTWFR
jgi:hypothetical protein